SNEQLYGSVEVILTENYRLDQKVPGGRSLANSESKKRYVFQGGLFYSSDDGTDAAVDGRSHTYHIIRAYDGDRTRHGQDNLVNIHHGQVGSPGPTFPHAWMLPNSAMAIPLSLRLTGGKELQNHPDAGHNKDYYDSSFYERDEVVDGLSCHVVRCEG